MTEFERLAPERHDTLEGVPEPAENPVLVGHEQAKSAVAAAYRVGKLPHGLLLAGPHGIGKATLAFHIAYHLLSHPTAETTPETILPPDPASSLYRQIATGAHPSVLHLTRPFNDKTKKFATLLTVDEIRRVSRFLSMTSHDNSYRVVIVDPADDMNTSAANALLKNLEEPPSRTIFLLITHSAGALLPTIRSRCHMIRLQPLSRSEVEQALQRLGVALPQDQGTRAALLERAGGSVRQAILFSEFGGLEIAETVEVLIKGQTMDFAKAHRLADAVSGREQEIRFDLMNQHMLDLVSAAAEGAATAGHVERAARLARQWHELRIAIGETDTYNLDRKQHALSMILRLHDTFRM
ncbi:DNA polymerase III subunit delta' [Pseudaminobacter sp. 19-2017]|uniref:DNA polymerase III subunit delta n=1 Tax=Pseudaminobacter soli (ex Zhang et al. 2022) TaxID=2831468 RepID=A0A942DUW0_9HYPH|nr:DNA polymerase III subunit delta' [Pseudaminobacter soli]MBS3647114.1 DNA polymerase III subunit delta' [Pseudaminobacter soli]